MTETKKIEVRGKTYTIKRFNFEEGAVVDDLVAKATSPAESQVAMVFYGVADPKFESIDVVKQADRETVLHLYYEINRFNQMEPAFLSLLKRSQSQGSRRSETKTS